MIVGLNIQTTGLDPMTARLVEYGIVLMNRTGKVHAVRQTIVDSGEPIPADAERIHHISSWQAQTEGIATQEAISYLTGVFRWAASLGHPLAAFNAPYTLTIIRQEAQRVSPDNDLLALLDSMQVIDPLVIDKEVDARRPGPRYLDRLIDLYGVVWEGAEVDDPGEFEDSVAVSQAMKVAALAVNFLGHPAVEGLSLTELHDQQVYWAKEQKNELMNYYRRKRQMQKAEEVEHGWPFRK